MIWHRDAGGYPSNEQLGPAPHALPEINGTFTASAYKVSPATKHSSAVTRMSEKSKVDGFWSWFRGIAATLAVDVENPSLLGELDEKVLELDSKLDWEIGPGSTEPWQLVISPSLDRELWQKARGIVARAPAIKGWEFHSASTAKDWDYEFTMEGSNGEQHITLDASEWGFVFLRYPDGGQEVVLHGDNLPPLTDDDRMLAAAITLESILASGAFGQGHRV